MTAITTNAERRWIGRAIGRGCIVCRRLGYGETPAEWHHLRFGMGAGQRNWNLVGIALCPAHHRQGGHAVAYHAGPDAWQKLYGTELELLNQTIEELA